MLPAKLCGCCWYNIEIVISIIKIDSGNTGYLNSEETGSIKHAKDQELVLLAEQHYNCLHTR